MCKFFVTAIGLCAAGAFLTCVFGCHNNPRVAGPARDSVAAGDAPIYRTAKDTETRTHVLLPGTDSSEETGEDELKGFYDEYIASYTERCVIDTAFRLGTDHYRLYVKDSCLMDSAIVIPKGYVYMYKLDSFVTHNFISKIRLERDGETILDRLITRKDFDLLLDASLRRYATIRCPNMDLKHDSIRLGYSISIPLTDVGQRKYVIIDAAGNLSLREPGPAD